MENNTTINNMNDIVNRFNDFFVNIGPKLSEEIQDPVTSNDNLIDRNSKTMFLMPVEEKEIIDIVNECKSKSSTDYNEIDMIIVKRVINGISKPLRHIFNLSLQTGQFPYNVKIAKVVPLYKAGDKHLFTNYRPVSPLPQF